MTKLNLIVLASFSLAIGHVLEAIAGSKPELSLSASLLLAVGHGLEAIALLQQ